MRFTEVIGRSVVSTSAAVAVGKVKSLVVDPKSAQVVAVLLKKTEGDGELLLWSELTAFGPDAVTVAEASAIRVEDPSVDNLLGKDHELKSKRVLTEDGFELGKVVDVEFDPDTGTVIALLLTDESVAGDRLLGVGSYAVIVARAD